VTLFVSGSENCGYQKEDSVPSEGNFVSVSFQVTIVSVDSVTSSVDRA
jgi:hypothetical protein